MGRFFFILAITTLSVLFLLFLPIVISIDTYYNMNRRKFAFALKLYRVIPVLGGYISAYPGGLAVHTSQTKARLLFYKDMEKERKRIKLYKSFRLLKGNLHTEIGAEYILQAMVVHILARAAFYTLIDNKQEIKNSVWLTDGDVLKLSLHLVAYVNIFLLLRLFFDYIKEKVSHV